MKCRKCGSIENLTVAATVTYNTKKYTYYVCREHNAEQRRITYARNPTAIKKANDKYRRTHPERLKAWGAVRGIKPEPCEVCGNPNTQKHHPDPIQKTLIIHLCSIHHKEAHTKKYVML